MTSMLNVLESEKAIRLFVFTVVFATMALWEFAYPRRKLNYSKTDRWTSNLLLTFSNTVLIRFLFPAAAVGLAYFVQRQGWGVFSVFSVSPIVVIVSSVIFLDLVIYFQHLMFHATPLLWRIHKMHHADLDIDLTTGNRFHPIEMILSMFIKFAAIIVVGAPPVAVIIFEVILNGAAMFNHSNVKLPLTIDRVLRLILVTPDMHRVHHSIKMKETNSNFGFNLPWWDMIFGTYKSQPDDGHLKMTIGLKKLRDKKECLTLLGMWEIPFKKK